MRGSGWRRVGQHQLSDSPATRAFHITIVLDSPDLPHRLCLCEWVYRKAPVLCWCFSCLPHVIPANCVCAHTVGWDHIKGTDIKACPAKPPLATARSVWQSWPPARSPWGAHPFPQLFGTWGSSKHLPLFMGRQRQQANMAPKGRRIVCSSAALDKVRVESLFRGSSAAASSRQAFSPQAEQWSIPTVSPPSE